MPALRRLRAYPASRMLMAEVLAPAAPMTFGVRCPRRFSPAGVEEPTLARRAGPKADSLLQRLPAEMGARFSLLRHETQGDAAARPSISYPLRTVIHGIAVVYRCHSSGPLSGFFRGRSGRNDPALAPGVVGH